jgi:hypothetical protein
MGCRLTHYTYSVLYDERKLSGAVNLAHTDTAAYLAEQESLLKPVFPWPPLCAQCLKRKSFGKRPRLPRVCS